jgi:hypothetical protein
VKVLLASFYFPAVGIRGVRRPLELARYLSAVGIETHVLTVDTPESISAGEAPRVPTQAWVHRARYLGPSAGPSGDAALARVATQARMLVRRALVPDEQISWNITAIPAGIRIVREHRIDAVITTSPPASTHLIGAGVKRVTGAAWLADLPDLSAGSSSSPAEGARVWAGKAAGMVASLVARQADAITCASDATAEQARRKRTRGCVVRISDGSGLEQTIDLLRSLQ